MHISRILAKGFRNFEDLDLTDLPPAHVIVGENRAGKSNLLHALRLVLDPSLPDTARQLGAEDFWDGFADPFDGNEILVSIELTGFENDKRAMALLGDYLVAFSPKIARLNYVYRPRPLATSAASEADYEAVLFGGDQPDSRIGRDVLRYVSLRVLPALRDAEGDLNSVRSPLRRLVARVQLDPAQMVKVTDSITDASDALLGDPGIAAINTGITARIDAMVGELFSVSTTLGVASNDATQLVRSVRLFIDDVKQRTVGQTSLGTSNLLYLALLLELIGAQEAAGETVSTILAVEEPEAHLHPHLQRVLFRHFLADSRPVIVTTHSPHLASVAPLLSLTMLRSVDGESQAFHARNLGLSDRVHADLERYLDVTRAELLFSKAVILVEGAAEQFLIPAFAAAAGIDLDSYGVTVCSVHGTDFQPYRTLLGKNGFNVPHVVVTDGDPDENGGSVGLARGCALVSAATRQKCEAAIANEDVDGARRALRTGNVFVGLHTLELDLIPHARLAMADAYDELESSTTKRRNFGRDLDACASGARDRNAAILNRLTDLGKGRYAQRLAAHLVNVTPPEYISLALDRIRSKVQMP